MVAPDNVGIGGWVMSVWLPCREKLRSELMALFAEAGVLALKFMPFGGLFAP